MKIKLSLISLLMSVLYFPQSPLWAQAGNAINFQNYTYNSHGDFIYCGQPNFGFSNQLTVAAWIKWTTDPGSWAVGNHNQTGSEREGYYSTYIAYSTHNTLNTTTEHGQFWLRNLKTGNHFEFTVENTSGTKAAASSSINPNSGTWYFLVGTYDGSTVKLYVDGVLDGSASLSGNVRSNSDCRLNMGRLPWGYGLFVGYMDEVRVWNVALTQTEIQNQKVSKSTVQDANCKSYWNFDAGSGTVITDSKGLASGVFYSALIDVHSSSDFPNKLINDADRAFVTGAWDGKSVHTVAGAGVDETNIIISNTGNIFTFTYGFAGTAPDNRTTPITDGTLNMTWFGVLNTSETSQWVSSSDLSLPVDLSSFSAVCEGQSVILEWVTESETDNLGFILERALVIHNFKPPKWEQIASYQTNDALKGQGNTSSKTEYAFTDTDVEPGTAYQYRVSDVSTDGKVTVYASLSIEVDALPEVTAMEKAYPNPFNPSTYISYHLAEDSQVEIAVYDMLGRKVQTLFNGQQLAGSYHVYWHGKNEAGNISPTGAYLIRMQTENIVQVQKVLLMK